MTIKKLSYSAYSVYKESPLQYYFQYIKKVEKSNPTKLGYGAAGNIVHEATENYINRKDEDFEIVWNNKQGDELVGFKNRKLDKTSYKNMYHDSVEFMNKLFHSYKGKTFAYKTELKILKEFYGVMFTSYIDLYIEVDGVILIKDWKTNSTDNYEMHKSQRLFYAWIIWKIKGTIPLCEWVYFKSGRSHKDVFIKDEILDFDQEIQNFIKIIERKGDNIYEYEGGNFKNPFNEYYNLCLEEIGKRQEQEYMEIRMAIKGNYVFLEGDVDPKLKEGIDFKTKFDLKEKFWMQQQVRKKGYGIIKLDDVGTVHLFNMKFNCFPIGLLDPVTKICYEFGKYYNKKVKIFLEDRRDANIMNSKLNIMYQKLNTDKVLRDYQQEAVKKFLEKESGIINIATGGGKTMVASEIIIRCKAKTLWIVDRKELLAQTKKTLQELLAAEIGEISGGKINIKDITIATIQSLNSNLSRLQEYLYSVNFVCVDEYHKSAAETYQKVFAKLPNTKYRLGLTATPYRDDGKDPILFSILGDIVYTITSRDLINLGYLVEPIIEFHTMKNLSLFSKDYSEDYNLNIVFNGERNGKIRNIVEKNLNKKILILTKLVDHGKLICDMLPNTQHLHGKSKGREGLMECFQLAKVGCLVMTQSIGCTGLDIPDLDIIINCGANKGDVASVQTLGRVLRIFTNKNSARYIDFLDTGVHTRKHSKARIKAFEEQGHKVNLI